ncbi:MAG: hypothetical protein WCF54_19215 [Terracidiphilus sp.]
MKLNQWSLRALNEHRWLYGAMAFALGLCIMGADYYLHPEAGRFQSQVVQELKSLPLPPNSD